MRNLTLHPRWLTMMPAYEHAVCVCTHSLSALAFYLMLTKTAQPTKPFAKYLMLLQSSITLVDLNYGLLYCPIVLFPVPGGLCNGILCTWLGNTAQGLPYWIGHHVRNSLLHANQSGAFAIDPTIFAGYGNLFVSSTLLAIILTSIIATYLVVNRFYRLWRQGTLSEVTRRMLHQAMVQLIFQTVTPLTVQMTPILLYVYAMVYGWLDPNVTNIILCVQLTHSLLHTAILILTTPSYREPLMIWQRRTSVTELPILRCASGTRRRSEPWTRPKSTNARRISYPITLTLI